jgi:hypothetical protein
MRSLWRGVAGFCREALSRVRPSRNSVPARVRLMGEVYDEDDSTWPMVVVQWRDTHSAPGTWIEPGMYQPEPVMALSVGWVWPQCLEGHLTVVGTVMPDAENPALVSDVTHIPMENVVRMFSLATHLPVNWFDEGIA